MLLTLNHKLCILNSKYMYRYVSSCIVMHRELHLHGEDLVHHEVCLFLSSSFVLQPFYSSFQVADLIPYLYIYTDVWGTKVRTYARMGLVWLQNQNTHDISVKMSICRSPLIRLA